MQSNNPPKNCREAFTAEGDQVFNRRYYSSDYLRPKYLSKDVEAEIRLATRNVVLVFKKTIHVFIDTTNEIVYLSVWMYVHQRYPPSTTLLSLLLTLRFIYPF